MHVPGIKVASPMSPLEYQEVWNTFMSQDDPIVVSEHRDSFKLKEEIPDIVRDDADITIFLISVCKLMNEALYKTLLDIGVKSNIINILWLKPLVLPSYTIEVLSKTKVGLVVEPEYELVGASQSIAYKLMYETGLRVKALGAPDRCITAKKSNKIIPMVEDVVREVNTLLNR